MSEGAREGAGNPSPYPSNYSDKVLSVLTLNEVRYQGTLDKINPVERSIVLRDVTVFGTEDRPVQKRMPRYAEKFPLVNLKGANIKHATLYEYVRISANRQDDGGNSAPHGKAACPPFPADQQGPVPQQQQQRHQQQQQQQHQAPSSYLDAVRGSKPAAAADSRRRGPPAGQWAQPQRPVMHSS